MGGFVSAGGLKTWYEEQGTGEPLVMLHGDVWNAENFSKQIPVFATKYRVIIPERRGHGRTEDLPGDYNYDLCAKDTEAFIDVMGLKRVNLLGHSGGADMALRIAASRPDLVSKLVVISGESKIEPTEEQKTRTLSMSPDGFRKFAGFIVESCERVTPNGARRFPLFFEKIKKMWATEWGIPDSELGSITAKTLIMLGDHDFGTVEEAAVLSRKIPKAQFCVVPGAGHGLVFEKPCNTGLPGRILNVFDVPQGILLQTIASWLS
jgi:pimeloyl-ACP methyl ester carboxylesterase